MSADASHRSSDVLRKVRLGQPLDAALHSKPLPTSSRKKCQDVNKPGNSKLVDAKSATDSSVVFRREEGLYPLQGIRVRQPLHVDSLRFSPVFRNSPHKQNLLPSADVVVPLKTYKGKGYGKSIILEDEDVVSDDPSTPSSTHNQHKAALIIARFFRSVCRLDHSADRAQGVLRRRWREQHPEKFRTPLFELTNYEQLRVLQLYNPHLYGSHHSTSPLSSTSSSIRLSRVPRMEERKRIRQLEVLARMDKDAALLQETSRQRTQTPIRATTTLHEAYQRQSLAPQERPRIVRGYERLQQTHDLVEFPKTPPNFRYKTMPQARIFMDRPLKSVSTLQPLTR